MTSTVSVDGQKVTVDNGKRENAKGWFLYSTKDPSDATKALTGEPVTYSGLDEAIRNVEEQLEQVLCGDNGEKGGSLEGTESDPFVAMFGFSQGAVFCHLLAALDQTKHPLFARIRATILASGFPATHVPTNNSPYTFTSTFLQTKEEDEEQQSQTDLNDQQHLLPLPSLHVIGRKDTSVTPEKSTALAARFVNSEILWHDKGHMIPQQTANTAKMVAFLDGVGGSR